MRKNFVLLILVLLSIDLSFADSDIVLDSGYCQGKIIFKKPVGTQYFYTVFSVVDSLRFSNGMVLSIAAVLDPGPMWHVVFGGIGINDKSVEVVYKNSPHLTISEEWSSLTSLGNPLKKQLTRFVGNPDTIWNLATVFPKNFISADSCFFLKSVDDWQWDSLRCFKGKIFFRIDGDEFNSMISHTRYLDSINDVFYLFHKGSKRHFKMQLVKGKDEFRWAADSCGNGQFKKYDSVSISSNNTRLPKTGDSDYHFTIAHNQLTLCILDPFQKAQIHVVLCNTKGQKLFSNYITDKMTIPLQHGCFFLKIKSKNMALTHKITN